MKHSRGGRRPNLAAAPGSVSSQPDCLVLLASSVPSVVRSWREALEKVYAVEEATTVESLERLMVQQRPSILLLDLALKGIRPPSSITDLLNLNPQTNIITFPPTLNEIECAKAIRAGARGCCHLHIDGILLKKAIQMVQKGELWIQRKCAAYILNQLLSIRPVFENGTRGTALEELTPRELDIVAGIGDGKSNKQIAGLLNITEATVKAHLTNIFAKLGVSGRLELVLMLHRSGSVTDWPLTEERSAHQ